MPTKKRGFAVKQETAYPYGEEWMKHLLEDDLSGALGAPVPLDTEEAPLQTARWCYHAALLVVMSVLSSAPSLACGDGVLDAA
ncbi:hypothetical protein AK812_SmicGene13567 [Symbiodinium microadriaticum]|uniref:Uncharacterized protein n=1 Tax=Symbiodinium microadriaticum TaxID=2951 RepID=A0A1Q9E7V7_SYMMI|nr:hypothetical protein AK812_SmicGene13567 [Symbiodinium microadriaticum]